MMFENLNIEKQVPLLIDFRVGIEYVCKYDQCLCPQWIMDKNKNKNKNEI